MKFIVGLFFACSLLAFADLQIGGSTGTLGNDAAHINIGGHLPLQEIYVYQNGTLIKVWEDLDNPVITAFDVIPTDIDLDTRPTGTLVFTIGVTGVAGSVTNAQVVILPQGTNVGPNHVAAAGANINTTLSNIPQPNKTTTYRLYAHNDAGNAHKDATVTVTKNPTLANCRRTGFIDSTATYYFAFTTTGLPQPTVTYRFSGGQQGTVSPRHLVQGANPYTWNVPDRAWRITFANSNAQSLTLTATSSQGTATCTIANINN